jgi:hypothetical protein
VHRLLRHLETMPAVPNFSGIDDQQREVLDYLQGRVVDVDHATLTDAQLAATVTWTRRPARGDQRVLRPRAVQVPSATRR